MIVVVVVVVFVVAAFPFESDDLWELGLGAIVRSLRLVYEEGGGVGEGGSGGGGGVVMNDPISSYLRFLSFWTSSSSGCNTRGR